MLHSVLMVRAHAGVTACPTRVDRNSHMQWRETPGPPWPTSAPFFLVMCSQSKKKGALWDSSLANGSTLPSLMVHCFWFWFRDLGDFGGGEDKALGIFQSCSSLKEKINSWPTCWWSQSPNTCPYGIGDLDLYFCFFYFAIYFYFVVEVGIKHAGPHTCRAPLCL